MPSLFIRVLYGFCNILWSFSNEVFRLCSGITAVHYSICIAMYSTRCINSQALIPHDFLHCNLMCSLPVASLSQKTPTKNQPSKRKTPPQNQNKPQTKKPIDFIGLLAQRNKLHISEIFLFEMLRSHLQLSHINTSVDMFLPFIKCSLKAIHQFCF